MFDLWFPRQKNINLNIKDELLILSIVEKSHFDRLANKK